MLMVNQFNGFGVAQAGAAALTASYITHVESGTDGTSYSFATTDIGTAAADRVVILAVAAESGADKDMAITGITVGGVVATSQSAGAHRTGSFDCTLAELWSVALNASYGTTATIVVSLSATARACGLAVYTAGMASITATYAANDTVDPMVMTIDCAAGGFIIACAAGKNDAGAARTWTVTGLTEDTEWAIEGNNEVVVAHENFAVAQSSLSITLDCSATPATSAGCAAAWG